MSDSPKRKEQRLIRNRHGRWVGEEDYYRGLDSANTRALRQDDGEDGIREIHRSHEGERMADGFFMLELGDDEE